MNETTILKRLALLKQRPDVIKPLDTEELAQFLLLLLQYVKRTDKNVKDGVLKGDPGKDGKTPQPDKDYLSAATSKNLINGLFQDAYKQFKAQVDALAPRDGRDAEITEEHVKMAAERAYKMITLPDFDTLITQEPAAIRDALELLNDDERLSLDAIRGLREALNDLSVRQLDTARAVGGGASQNWVKSTIAAISLNDLADVTVSATEPSNPSTGDFWVDIS